MPSTQSIVLATPVRSPLMLADRMITLAQDADRAGYSKAASRLVRLACKVLDRQPTISMTPMRRPQRPRRTQSASVSDAP